MLGEKLRTLRIMSCTHTGEATKGVIGFNSILMATIIFCDEIL